MLSTLLSSASVAREYVSLVDIVAYRRPSANRLFDQIYMMTGDMLTQVDIMQDYLATKNVVFLGDGDGMSMLFGLFATKGIINSPKSLSVLDFDERIVNNALNFSEEFRFSDKLRFSCEKYNVIERIPDKHREKYDFFYINPPYGSKNTGVSCEVWLHRCMDLCKTASSGCIIIPYDMEQEWTVKAMIYVQKFLLSHGFVIRDMVSYMHSYHLKDNPVLRSATLIVDRIDNVQSEYASQNLPVELLKNLYGEPRPIPRYICDNGTPTGEPNYDWEYGKEFWEKKM